MRKVILDIVDDNVKVSEEKVVIAEGRLTAIHGSLRGLRWDTCLHDEKHSVVNTFYDADNCYYVNIYDHRHLQVTDYMETPESYKAKFFDYHPCLVTMRKKGRTLYMALVDIGDPETDIVDNEELELAVGGHFDRLKNCVVHGAVHPATGICLVGGRRT